MNRTKRHLPGILLSAILLILMVVFDVLLLRTQMVPTKLLIPVCVALLLVVVVIALLVWDCGKKLRFWIGVVLGVLAAILLVYGSHAMAKTIRTLDTITNVKTEIAQVGVYVRQDDPAEYLQDAADYPFGILAALDRENTDEVLAQIGDTLGAQVSTTEYPGLTELVDALYQQEVGAIVLNAAYLDVLEEIEGYEDVDTRIREISAMQVETVIDTIPQDTGSDTAAGDDVFTVFISGIDTRGNLTAKSRSDVNIIATVNTTTHQVLLVSTPRDYFVPLSISNGVPDKLTHAGIYGVQVCMDTLGMLYDMEMDYYFRVNFGGFVNIIDALGGVTVQSDYDFTAGGYHYNVGANTVDGEQALAFARERYSFAEGDRQRGKNQMAVIKAVLNKAMSPELLTNYTSLLSAMEGSFETSVSYDLLATLVRDQLNSGAEWNIVSYSVDGTGDSRKPYSMSQKAYVMIPDQSTVDTAKELMRQVRDGEIITAP